MEGNKDWVKGLAALIYYEKPKYTEKTKSKPGMSIQFETLTDEEQSRYISIANNIFNYLGKLNLDVVKKVKVAANVDPHAMRIQKYEETLVVVKKWVTEVKLLKKVGGLIPWEELAKRASNV